MDDDEQRERSSRETIFEPSEKRASDSLRIVNLEAAARLLIITFR